MITVCMVTIVGVEGTKEFANREAAIAEIKAKGWRIEFENQNEIVVRVPLPKPDKSRPLREHSVRAI